MMSMVMALLDVAACAVAAGVTNYLLLERREARHFASSKAEELYNLVESWEQGLVAYFARTCSLIVDGCAYIPNVEGPEARLMGDSARARMLVSLYFPALGPQVKRADAAVASALQAMRLYQAENGENNALLGLEQTLIDMRETFESLKHAVVVEHRDRERRLPAPRKLAKPVEALRLAV
jgi:hypothetical protein